MKGFNTKSRWNKLLRTGAWGKERGEFHKKILKYLPKNKEITVLDIGCAVGHGTIELAKKLKKAKFEACDFSNDGIKKAKGLYGKKIKFFVHDVYKDKLKKKYDYILIIETLEHLKNPKKIVKKYLKSCKILLVSVPYKEKELWKEHINRFDESSFRDFKELIKRVIFRKPGSDMKLILYIFEK
ncbi:MAG: methyltransferase domain-containing protein [archaeon]|nr:MAG: methyltransferase domain-containing protein [archaeon]